ncbi:Allergen [Penicillium lividum]|nr:Allergen [Penicillium lividum]
MRLFQFMSALIWFGIPATPVLRKQDVLTSPRIYLITNLARSTPPSDRKAHSGNIGVQYGSNIIEVPADKANQYKYVVRFIGPPEGESWSLVIWNKLRPDGIPGGWYGKACKKFIIAAGQTLFVAFNEDSQGGWAAAPGIALPSDSKGGYASTWGEFDFGSSINNGWSGFDNAGLTIQGMQICDVLTYICSAITRDASDVHNAYIREVADIGGIGGNLAPGPVRLEVALDYAE